MDQAKLEIGLVVLDICRWNWMTLGRGNRQRKVPNG
jgi:hypothetical protein